MCTLCLFDVDPVPLRYLSRMKQETIQTVFLGILALAVAAIAWRGFSETRSTSRREYVTEWEEYQVPATTIAQGDGSLVIIEFSDFQCPFCRGIQESLTTLIDKHAGKITLLYRHLPLPYHPHARTAAEASECAAEQGAFRSYHDLLFMHQDSIGARSWTSFADEAGVNDIPKFEECIIQRRYRDRIEADLAAASDLGLTGTPSFLVNGRSVVGVIPIEEFEAEMR